MIVLFATAGALIALIPGASFFLVPMEWFMLYLISAKHDTFEFPSFLLMASAITMISFFLKGLALFLHVFPILGQIANSLVAFCFIGALGTLAEIYYSSKT